MDDTLRLEIEVAKLKGWRAEQDIDEWWVYDETGKGVNWGGTEELAWNNSVEDWASDFNRAYGLTFTGSLYGTDLDMSEGFGVFLCNHFKLTPQQLIELWLKWKAGL